jgi:hypothetical protein
MTAINCPEPYRPCPDGPGSSEPSTRKETPKAPILSGAFSLKTSRQWFDGFVDSYQRQDPDAWADFENKRRHTLKVLEEIRLLGAALLLDERLSRLADIIALFHDLGRFEQLLHYSTLLDAGSIDHAMLSVAIMRRGDLLTELPRRDCALVKAAILLHNRLRLRQGLNPELAVLARLLRDADKLANFPDLLDNFDSHANNFDTLRMPLEHRPGAFTPEVFAEVAANRAVDYRRVRFANDILIAALGWTFDLNFDHTRREVLDRGYIDRFATLLPQTSPFVKMIQIVRRGLSLI